MLLQRPLPVFSGMEQTVHVPMYAGCSSGTEHGVLSLFSAEQVTTEPPKSQSNAHCNYSSEASEMANDVQRDQSAPPLQEKTARDSTTTTANAPTVPPFISFPITKSPGTSMQSMSYSSSVRYKSVCISVLCQSLLAVRISKDCGSQ